LASLPLVGLWDKRYLIFHFAVLNIKMRFKSTYLGILWAAVEPLLTFIVLYFVFTSIRAQQIDFDILLLDEIQAVGDKNFRKKSHDTFLSLKNKNKAIIHATHNLDKLSEFSDRLLLLHQGKMVMIGKPEEVIEKYNEVKPTN